MAAKPVVSAWMSWASRRDSDCFARKYRGLAAAPSSGQMTRTEGGCLVLHAKNAGMMNMAPGPPSLAPAAFVMLLECMKPRQLSARVRTPSMPKSLYTASSTASAMSSPSPHMVMRPR